MDEKSISKVEAELSVTLPEAYKAILATGRIGASDHGLFDAHDLIVARTKEYRIGYGGAPKWSIHFLYIGDQEDACPYMLDCSTGRVIHSDHGDISSPLAEYESIGSLFEELTKDQRTENKRPWWKIWK